MESASKKAFKERKHRHFKDQSQFTCAICSSNGGACPQRALGVPFCEIAARRTTRKSACLKRFQRRY